jgi:hypothetical protein
MGSKSKVFKILGNPKHPEPAEHRIEFPGGAVNIARTSEGDYWAHIIVNRGQAIPDTVGLDSAIASIDVTRITSDHGVDTIAEEYTNITQVAVLISQEQLVSGDTE